MRVKGQKSGKHDCVCARGADRPSPLLPAVGDNLFSDKPLPLSAVGTSIALGHPYIRPRAVLGRPLPPGGLKTRSPNPENLPHPPINSGTQCGSCTKTNGTPILGVPLYGSRRLDV